MMLERLLFVPVLIFSIVVHECAHGIAAFRAGDPTAKMMGRITLNPLPHIDLFGSIIIPGLLLLTGSSFLFGWARPVPVNPRYFRNYRQDEIRVSFAGPAANLLLSLLFFLLMVFLVLISGSKIYSSPLFTLFFKVFQSGILINLVLAFFNLLPIPPLDGSHILENVLPPQYAQFFAMIRPYGFVILLLFLMTPLVNIIYLPVSWVYQIYLTLLQMVM